MHVHMLPSGHVVAEWSEDGLQKRRIWAPGMDTTNAPSEVKKLAAKWTKDVVDNYQNDDLFSHDSKPPFLLRIRKEYHRRVNKVVDPVMLSMFTIEAADGVLSQADTTALKKCREWVRQCRTAARQIFDDNLDERDDKNWPECPSIVVELFERE